jgi:predicted RecA/RadA family phage recombinase
MPIATLVQEGDTLDHTPGSAVAAGDLVALDSDLCGVAQRDIAAGQLGAIRVKGVFSVETESGATIAAAGVTVYIGANGKATNANTSGNVVGKSLAALADGRVLVLLNA